MLLCSLNLQKRFSICAIFACCFLWASFANASNSLEQAMYFKGKPKDDSACAMIYKDGQIVFPKKIINPAVTCPDAFAWKRFMETIKSEFWNQWAYDNYTYPTKPYALCDKTTDGQACCDPTKNQNPGYKNTDNPGMHCPYFPGDHKRNVMVSANKQTKQRGRSAHYTVASETDPGRVIRQEMAEVVFRNKAMWKYNFENDLYNQEGLGGVFSTSSADIHANAPYYNVDNQVSFPTEAIMFKTDWLHEDDAHKLGLKQNKKHPYITMNMRSPVGDNDANVFREGLHYLMAITAASKDLPNWHWYAIEHVNNPGRCDYTGCNDSYGYFSKDVIPKGYSKNYVVPHTINDGLEQSSPIFDTGKRYPAEDINPELAKLFKKIKIGQKSRKDSKNPSVSDRAWLSYRLKGVQNEFVTNEGVNTIVGNSVTEGGFVNSSSCMTCHSQATVNAQGQPAIGSIGFSNQMNLLGYPQSANGAPENSWFFQPGTITPLNAKIDFVWGILFAQPLVVPE